MWVKHMKTPLSLYGIQCEILRGITMDSTGLPEFSDVIAHVKLLWKKFYMEISWNDFHASNVCHGNSMEHKTGASKMQDNRSLVCTLMVVQADFSRTETQKYADIFYSKNDTIATIKPKGEAFQSHHTNPTNAHRSVRLKLRLNLVLSTW